MPAAFHTRYLGSTRDRALPSDTVTRSLARSAPLTIALAVLCTVDGLYVSPFLLQPLCSIALVLVMICVGERVLPRADTANVELRDGLK